MQQPCTLKQGRRIYFVEVPDSAENRREYGASINKYGTGVVRANYETMGGLNAVWGITSGACRGTGTSGGTAVFSGGGEDGTAGKQTGII